MAASDAASQRAARGLLQIQQLPQAQVVPTRRMRGAPAAVAGGKGDRGGAAAASAAVADDRSTVPADLTDLLPRTDISGQVTEELIRRLGSANWKACRCPIQSCHMSIMYCSERAAHGQQATRFCGGAGQRQLEGAQPIMLLKSRFFRRDGSRLCVRGMLGECPVRGRVFVLPSRKLAPFRHACATSQYAGCRAQIRRVRHSSGQTYVPMPTLFAINGFAQERAAGLEAVDGLLVAASGRITPNVGDLMGALKVLSRRLRHASWGLTHFRCPLLPPSVDPCS